MARDLASGYHDVADVSLDEIDPRLRPARQARARLDDEAIERYGPLQRAGKLPAVKLMYDAGVNIHWVVDGAHTITAAIRVGCRDVRALVKPGSYVDAFREATRCNLEHGVPLREADKRHAVLEFLDSVPGAGDMSQQDIADICNVTQGYVSKVMCTIIPGNNRAPSANGVHLTPAERAVADAYAANPTAPVAEVARTTGISARTVVKARGKLGLARSSAASGRGAAAGGDDDDDDDDGAAVAPAVVEAALGIPFLAELHTDEVEQQLDAMMRAWPRSAWARFLNLCRGWAERTASGIGVILVPNRIPPGVPHGDDREYPVLSDGEGGHRTLSSG